jgi:uncharacterized protein YceK
MANLSEQLGPGERKVFGGVRLDAKLGSGYMAYAAHTDGVYWLYAAGTACALAADMPISAVADTMTLPWTLLPAPKKPSHRHEGEEGDRDSQQPNPNADADDPTQAEDP